MKQTRSQSIDSANKNANSQSLSADILSRNDEGFMLQIYIPYTASMLKSEEIIQDRLNEAGVKATEEVLGRFDTDGSPIQYGSETFFSKGKEPKTYQSPYGQVVIERHVYQTSKGGKTFCPLEHNARIIITSTPKFAKTVSSKYADLGGSRVQADLKENHGRNVARSYIQNIAEAVSAIVEAKEDKWQYQTPAVDKKISSIAIGLDGTTMLLCQDGYREAMVGTIALYDSEGERQHTNYIAASPEMGDHLRAVLRVVKIQVYMACGGSLMLGVKVCVARHSKLQKCLVQRHVLHATVDSRDV